MTWPGKVRFGGRKGTFLGVVEGPGMCIHSIHSIHRHMLYEMHQYAISNVGVSVLQAKEG